jgi:hypothetical protein
MTRKTDGRNKPRSKEFQKRQVETFAKVLKRGQGVKLAHIAELAEHIMAQWGGARQFAVAFYETFQDAHLRPPDDAC